MGGMLRTPLTLLVVASLLAPVAPAAAKCAPQVVTHQLVGHPADPIPSGGGVLVGWDSVNYNDATEVEGDPAARAGWRFKLGKKRVATVMTRLAPGLAVYRPKKVTRGKRYTLFGDNSARLGTFKFGGKRAKAMAAPDVTSVITSEEPHGRGMARSTTVTLGSAPPADAHGILVRVAGGEVFTWGPIVDRAALTITVYYHDGRCGRLPPDMRASNAGESVELLWVDRFGNLSPASNPLAAQ